MSKSILILFLFFANSLNAGYIEYYQFVNEGEYHMYQGQYELAITNFKIAFDKVERPKARDHYLLAKCYSQLNQENEMYDYLQLAIEGAIDKSFIKGDSLWFENHLFSQEYKHIINKKSKIEIQEIDEESKKAFKTIEKKFSRSKMIQYYNAFQNKDSLPDNYNNLMKTFVPYRDSLQRLFIDFCLNHTFPNDPKKLKTLALNSFMLFSYELPILDSLRAIFIENVDNGTISPLYFANIFNNLKTNENDPFSFPEEQFGMRENSIKEEDFERIIINRKSVGLSQYYMEAPNYDKNYKPTPISNCIKR